MKKYFNYIAVLIAGLILSGCNTYNSGDKVSINVPMYSIEDYIFITGTVVSEDDDSVLVEVADVSKDIEGTNAKHIKNEEFYEYFKEETSGLARKGDMSISLFVPIEYVNSYEEGKKKNEATKKLVKSVLKLKDSMPDIMEKKINALSKEMDEVNSSEINEYAQLRLLKAKLFYKVKKDDKEKYFSLISEFVDESLNILEDYDRQIILDSLNNRRKSNLSVKYFAKEINDFTGYSSFDIDYGHKDYIKDVKIVTDGVNKVYNTLTDDGELLIGDKTMKEFVDKKNKIIHDDLLSSSQDSINWYNFTNFIKENNKSKFITQEMADQYINNKKQKYADFTQLTGIEIFSQSDLNSFQEKLSNKLQKQEDSINYYLNGAKEGSFFGAERRMGRYSYDIKKYPTEENFEKVITSLNVFIKEFNNSKQAKEAKTYLEFVESEQERVLGEQLRKKKELESALKTYNKQIKSQSDSVSSMVANYNKVKNTIRAKNKAFESSNYSFQRAAKNATYVVKNHKRYEDPVEKIEPFSSTMNESVEIMTIEYQSFLELQNNIENTLSGSAEKIADLDKNITYLMKKAKELKGSKGFEYKNTYKNIKNAKSALSKTRKYVSKPKFNSHYNSYVKYIKATEDYIQEAKTAIEKYSPEVNQVISDVNIEAKESLVTQDKVVTRAIDGNISEKPTEKKASSETQTADDLLLVAEYQVDRNNLTSPKGDNAFQTYQEILAIDSNNLEAKKGIKTIAGKYKVWARSALNKNNPKKAKVYLNKAKKVTPKDEHIDKMLTEAGRMEQLSVADDSLEVKSRTKTGENTSDNDIKAPSIVVEETLEKGVDATIEIGKKIWGAFSN